MEEKFYAIINDTRQGPFTLAQLEEHGVGPDTYVWCKGMQKWRRARYVADVCRYWRQRLAGDPPASQEECATPSLEDNAHPEGPDEVRGSSFRSVRSFDPAEGEPGIDTSQPPRNYILPAILVTLLCMPLTGFIAIYFSARTRMLWESSLKNAATPKEAEDSRRLAHDSCRSAKMWIGITFFLGMIVQGFLMRHAMNII